MIAQAKVLRLLELMQAMCGKPMSIEQIANALNIHVRNAYRYLALIEQLGVEVKRTNSKGDDLPHRPMPVLREEKFYLGFASLNNCLTFKT